MSKRSVAVKTTFLKCQKCDVRGTEKPLSKCARCKVACYCSPECQKADWPFHQKLCNTNEWLANNHKEFDNTAEGMLERLNLTNGLSRYELDERIQKWVDIHNAVLMIATTEGCRLAEDIKRCRTYVLYVRIQAREDHDGVPGRWFRVVDAYPVPWADAMKKPEPWQTSISWVREMQDEAEANVKSYVAACMVECPPLAVQTVPFGSFSDISMKGQIVDEGWKEALKRTVEIGKRLPLACGHNHRA